MVFKVVGWCGERTFFFKFMIVITYFSLDFLVFDVIPESWQSELNLILLRRVDLEIPK